MHSKRFRHETFVDFVAPFFSLHLRNNLSIDREEEENNCSCETNSPLIEIQQSISCVRSHKRKANLTLNLSESSVEMWKVTAKWEIKSPRKFYLFHRTSRDICSALHRGGEIFVREYKIESQFQQRTEWSRFWPVSGLTNEKISINFKRENLSEESLLCNNEKQAPEITGWYF